MGKRRIYDIYYTDRYKREKRFNALVNNIVFAIVASSLNSYQLTQHTPTARMNLKEMLPLLVANISLLQHLTWCGQSLNNT